MEEATLQQVAAITQGSSFVASEADTLKKVYGEIDTLEKSPTKGRLYSQYRELLPFTFVPGLRLILLVLILGCARFRSLP